MQYIAAQDLTIAGNFDLFCQFSRVRQIIRTRSVVNEEPINLLQGVSHEVIRKLKATISSRKLKALTLWDLRSKPKLETSKMLKTLWKGPKGDIDRMVDSIFSLPFYKIEELKVHHEVEKSTGKSIGILKISFAIEGGNKRGRGNSPETSLALVLGSPARKTLLAHKSLAVRNGNSTRQAELRFDYSAANDGGGAGGGFMILRILMEEHRGLDSEIRVQLNG